MRTCLATIAAIAALAVTAAPSTAASAKPVRSGTILGWVYTWPATGWGLPTWPVGFSGEAMDCQGTEWVAGGNAECSAWLKSGCKATLAGRNPAVSASIEDVADLADGKTRRVFHWGGGEPVGGGAGVVVQLWRKDCTEIEASTWRSGHRYVRYQRVNQSSTSFLIPQAAKWMTITMNDGQNIHWTLR